MENSRELVICQLSFRLVGEEAQEAPCTDDTHESLLHYIAPRSIHRLFSRRLCGYARQMTHPGGDCMGRDEADLKRTAQ